MISNCQLEYYHSMEAFPHRICRVSEFEYYHPDEAVLYNSSPASHSEYYHPKLSVPYRRSPVSEIEYYRSLDAVLFLSDSFDHSRPYWRSSIITLRRRFRMIPPVCHSSDIFASRRPIRSIAHVYPASNFCHPEEAVSFGSSGVMALFLSPR